MSNKTYDWLAMDKNGAWHSYTAKPEISGRQWVIRLGDYQRCSESYLISLNLPDSFEITSWELSLIYIGALNELANAIFGFALLHSLVILI